MSTTFFSSSGPFSCLEKEVDMGKLRTEVDSKVLVIHELTRISKEKDKSIKEWEEQCIKDVASHDDEINKLDFRLAGKNSLLMTSFIYWYLRSVFLTGHTLCSEQAVKIKTTSGSFDPQSGGNKDYEDQSSRQHFSLKQYAQWTWCWGGDSSWRHCGQTYKRH